MKQLAVLLIICTLYNVNLLANNNFKSGYVIKLNGDTIHGLLLEQNGKNSFVNAVFKISPDSKEEEFSPEDIAGYRFNDGKYFVSIKLNSGPDKETKSVFMEFLIKGIVSIYYYIDSQGEHYYIEKDPYGLRELSEYARFNYDGKTLPPLYKGKLKSLMADCPEMEMDISEALLNYSSLVNIAKKYHNYVCNNDSCIIFEKQSISVSFDFGVTSGISYNNYRFGSEFISNYGLCYHIGSAVKIRNGFSNPDFQIYLGFLLGKESRYVIKAIDMQRILTYNGVPYNLNNYGDTISTPFYTSVPQLSVDIELVSLKVPIIIERKFHFENFSIDYGFGVINKILLSRNKELKALNFEEMYGRTFNPYFIGLAMKFGIGEKVFNNHFLSGSLMYEHLIDPIGIDSRWRLIENNFSLMLTYIF